MELTLFKPRRKAAKPGEDRGESRVSPAAVAEPVTESAGSREAVSSPGEPSRFGTLEVQLAEARGERLGHGLTAADCLRAQGAAERAGDHARARAYEIAAERRFTPRERLGL